MKKLFLILFILLFPGLGFSASLIVSYDFEDCSSDYPITSTYEGYMDIHKSVSECITTYNANEMSQTWTAYGGSYYFLQNSSATYPLDPSVSGITAGTVLGRNNYWLNETYCGSTACSDLKIEDEITTGEVFVRFWARFNKGFTTIQDHGRLKFIRFYADTHAVLDTVYMHLRTDNISPTMYFYCSGEGGWIPSESGPSLTNAYDGNWHKFSMYVNWNTGVILGWYDEDNETTGNAIKSYTAGDSSLGSGSEAEYVIIKSNFSNKSPTEETYFAIDDVEVWDGMPTVGDTPTLIMDSSGSTVTSTPLASITGTATATSGRTIDGVTSPGLTVTPDDGDWDEIEETFEVVNTDLDVGLNTFTFTATDSSSDIDIKDFTVTYSPTDTTAPVVTDFVIPTTSTSLTVDITTFIATDAVGVTGYLITEASGTPAIDHADWSESTWSEFVFSTEGAKTLYAWAKDFAGNISDSATDSVTITIGGCSQENWTECATQETCEAESLYWFDSSCYTIPEPNDWVGNNLITNGDFADWTDNDPDDWLIYNSTNVVESANGARLINDGIIRQLVLEDFKSYRYVANLVSVVSGELEVYHYDEIQSYDTPQTITGEFTMLDVPDHNIYFKLLDTIGDITINDIVLKEISSVNIIGVTFSQGVTILNGN